MLPASQIPTVRRYADLPGSPARVGPDRFSRNAPDKRSSRETVLLSCHTPHSDAHSIPRHYQEIINLPSKPPQRQPEIRAWGTCSRYSAGDLCRSGVISEGMWGVLLEARCNSELCVIVRCRPNLCRKSFLCEAQHAGGVTGSNSKYGFS